MFLQSLIIAASLLSMYPVMGVEREQDAHPHKLNFSFAEIGYEYDKKDSVYCGTDFKITPIWNLKRGNSDTREHWTNLETRMGYNYGMGENHTCTPYVAFGFSRFKFDKLNFDLEQLSYLAFGTKLMHSFGPIFEMGVHIKAHRNVMITYASDCSSKAQTSLVKRASVESPDWKMELRLPCVWHMGATKQWEIQFEPYYLQLPTYRKTEFYGTRITCGHRF